MFIAIGPVVHSDQDEVRAPASQRSRTADQVVIRLTERSDVEQSVAHDVANAFAAVQGAGWLLVERWAEMSDTQRVDMLDIVAAGSDRLAVVITSLLDDLPATVIDRFRHLLDLHPAADSNRGVDEAASRSTARR